MQRKIIAVVLLLTVGIIFNVSGGNVEADRAGINLSKKLRRILSAEMNAVQKGMTDIVIAIPAAKWDDIITTTRKMREGYIIKKKLSEKEMEEFNKSLPSGYKAIDDEFGKTADQLMQAAERHNGEQVNFYFYKLNETCISCHTKYANKRFPNFSTGL